LDGTWEVERTGGALPPMLGVRKRIDGASGETLVGPLPGVPFDVEGSTLRYRAPFVGLVDELEPDGDAFRGVATFRGHELGRFAMRRVSAEREDRAGSYLDDAYAAEQALLRQLDAALSSVDDLELRGELEHARHAAEARLERLAEHGASASTAREAGAAIAGLVQGLASLTRSADVARSLRDVYVAAHAALASYALAAHDPDQERARVSAQGRAETSELADAIAARWARIVDPSSRDS
jgi:ferritin-like metal-binding protein YciE